MLKSETAQAVIDHALFRGADFAELYVERHRSSQIELLSSHVDGINTGIDFGIGVRLFVDDRILYGYTNRTDREELLRITSLLLARDRRDAITQAVPFSGVRRIDVHPTELKLSETPSLEDKIRYLKVMDQTARAQGEKIQQFVGKILQREQDIEVFNSEGAHCQDTRHYTRIVSMAIAQDGDEQASGYEMPGALQGWEFNRKMDPVILATEAASSALRKLGADDCPSGELPVVLGNGFGGVIFHEACGHLLETTSVQKKASVFHDQMGEMIATSVVNAVDDGCIENEWGSLNIDDEGMPTERTQLIENGRLVHFMVDKMGAQKTGYRRTGSGRRQNYRYAPASRMRNTFIEAGDSELEDMIATIDYGIYAKKMGGGSVKPGTGEFNFAVREPYLIERGKISRPLRSATLISTGPKVLKEISMVGNDFAMSAGMCGSVSGAIPATVGQPSIKVDRILVGGQSE